MYSVSHLMCTSLWFELVILTTVVTVINITIFALQNKPGAKGKLCVQIHTVALGKYMTPQYNWKPSRKLSVNVKWAPQQLV